jgi:hypothetical protein
LLSRELWEDSADIFIIPVNLIRLGIAGAIVGQIIVVLLWVRGHELAHREAARGPRLVKVHTRLVGWWRNHAALWFSALALPPLWLVRFAEILLSTATG